MGFFKKIGKGLSGVAKTIGKHLTPEAQQKVLSHVPVIGGGLVAVSKAGEQIGHGIRDKDFGKIAGGIIDAGKGAGQTFTQAETGGLVGKKK
jgi:hypothetical protein